MDDPIESETCEMAMAAERDDMRPTGLMAMGRPRVGEVRTESTAWRLRVPTVLDGAARAMAERDGTTLSELVRRAVTAYVTREALADRNSVTPEEDARDRSRGFGDRTTTVDEWHVVDPESSREQSGHMMRLARARNVDAALREQLWEMLDTAVADMGKELRDLSGGTPNTTST